MNVPQPFDPENPANPMAKVVPWQEGGRIVSFGAAGNASGEVSLEVWREELVRHARRYVSKTEVAEDLVQEAFLRWERIKESVSQPRAWLFGTVRNLALHHLRDRKTTLNWEEGGEREVDSIFEHPAAALERLHRLELADRWLEGLQERERELIRLKFEEGLSYRQIGKRLRLKPSYVGYLLCVTLGQLRELAGREEGGS